MASVVDGPELGVDVNMRFPPPRVPPEWCWVTTSNYSIDLELQALPKEVYG